MLQIYDYFPNYLYFCRRKITKMEKTSDNKALIAHLAMFGACAGWGLMAPVGKDAMTHGFDGISMVTFRVVGGQVDVHRSSCLRTGV